MSDDYPLNNKQLLIKRDVSDLKDDCLKCRVFSGKAIFSQIELIHPQQFHRCVQRYGGDYKVRAFSCWDQFLAMAFAQLTFRESLRDIEGCLSTRREQLYHLGFRGRICRSTLADANESRDWRIYGDLAQLLIKRARTHYASRALEVELTQPRLPRS